MSTPTVPTDHLAGQYGQTHILLARLHDDELDEQIEHYRAQRSKHAGTLAGYHLANQLSAAFREKGRRSGE
jgi:adenosyl cobinamide kinase/adenosyl cobinamide phosphate guanylyltransferase